MGNNYKQVRIVNTIFIYFELIVNTIFKKNSTQQLLYQLSSNTQNFLLFALAIEILANWTSWFKALIMASWASNVTFKLFDIYS